jgi:hypothetical protein
LRIQQLKKGEDSNMASKSNVRRRRSDKRGKAEKVLELSRDAEAEAAKLLKGSQRGTITKVELNIGLRELDTRLKRIMHLVLRIL